MKLRIQFVAGILAASILVSILTVRWLHGQALAAVHKPTQVVIRAVLYDGYASGDADEAVQLQNNIFLTTTIAGWQLSDGSSSTARFPAGTELAPWQTIWVARDGNAFTTHFGFPPDFETVDSSPAIPNMEGIWPRYTNSGDRVMLIDADTAAARLSRLFGLEASSGLRDLLYRGDNISSIHSVSEEQQLWVMPAGKPVSSGNDRGRPWPLRKAINERNQPVDLVLVNGGELWSSRLHRNVAASADTVILVAENFETRTAELVQAAEQLQAAGARIGGLILVV